MIDVTHEIATPFVAGQPVTWWNGTRWRAGTFVGPCADPEHYGRCAWVRPPSSAPIPVPIDDLRSMRFAPRGWLR